MVAAIEGELCPSTGKVRMIDERAANVLRDQLRRRVDDPERTRLESYRCPDPDCRDWHVGHG